MPAETPQEAFGKDAPSSLSSDMVRRLREEADTILLLRRTNPGYGSSTFLLTDVADALETAETQLAEARAEIDSYRKRIQELASFFREVHGRCYFDGHEFSEQHGLVKLNETGTRLLMWGLKENEEAPSNRDEAPE